MRSSSVGVAAAWAWAAPWARTVAVATSSARLAPVLKGVLVMFVSCLFVKKLGRRVGLPGSGALVVSRHNKKAGDCVWQSPASVNFFQAWLGGGVCSRAVRATGILTWGFMP